MGHIATKEIASTIGSHNTASSLRQTKLVLNVDDLADVVQNLEAVDKLAALLREIEAWDHIGQELILDPEVALVVLVKELEELILEGLCCPALRK